MAATRRGTLNASIIVSVVDQHWFNADPDSVPNPVPGI